jgi:hypothetical protein
MVRALRSIIKRSTQDADVGITSFVAVATLRYRPPPSACIPGRFKSWVSSIPRSFWVARDIAVSAYSSDYKHTALGGKTQ